MGANLFHVNGQTDMMKPTVPSCSFADAPKKDTIFHIDHNCSLQLSTQGPRESHFNKYVHSRYRRRALNYPSTITVFSLLCIRYHGTEFLDQMSNNQLLQQDSKDGTNHF
jgi:hypothetical protein